MPSAREFKFRKTDCIGHPAAEDDYYLPSCFVDTGDLDVLKDCQNSRAIVVGRTGSGKSALLRILRNECQHVVDIDLRALALSYVSGSTILTFFEEDLGVKLDQFYQFLWRHIFVVALIKKHYNIQDESDKLSRLDRIWSEAVGNKARVRAYKYLNRFGDKFWTTTEECSKAVTTVTERDLSSSVGLDVSQLAILRAGGKLHLSELQTREYKQRGSEVVSRLQMSELSALMDALDEDILTDPKRRYYVVVDSLDEPWVEERLRPWLIRGLIETVRDFNRKVRHVKIIIALRVDLLNRVYKATSDAGFQEEKYLGLNLPVTWSRQDLEALLDKRVQTLVRERYTKGTVTLRDILRGGAGAKRLPGQSAVDYLLDRTLLRPRDAIQFFNACLEQAIEEPSISLQMLSRAEAVYSQQRRTALADEWSELYPHLIRLTDLLKGRPDHFTLHDISRSELDEIALHMAEADTLEHKPYAQDIAMFRAYFEGAIGEVALRARLAQCFYTIGLVGAKLGQHLGVLWSSNGGPASLNSAEVNDDIHLYVHKAFWRVLGIRDTTYTDQLA